jgi:lactoylglutathione lyase
MPVRQLRLVVLADDFDAALAFYRDALGMPEAEAVSSPGGRIAILDAGRATLELTDRPHGEYIDEVEVGRRVAGHIRVALEVGDSAAATDRAVDAGATRIAEPTVTPWNSLNSRLEAPAGLQLTLFQEMGAAAPAPEPATAVLEGFLAAFNAHDVDAIMGFFTDDCVMEMPRGPAPGGRRLVGQDAVREGVRSRFEGIPDIRYEDDRHWVCGDRAVSEWTIRGTQRTGEPIEVRGCDLLEFSGGRISRKDSFWKIVD